MIVEKSREDERKVILMWIIVLVILLLPGPLFTILNIRNLILHREHTGRFEIAAFTVGILYSLMLYGIWSPRAWNESIWIYSDFAALHEPFSREHILTLLVLMLVGLISYAFLKARKEKAAPLAAVISMAGVYLGIFTSIMVIIQLFGSVTASEPLSVSGWPFDVVLMMLVPFNYILLAVHLLIQVIRRQSRKLQAQLSLGCAPEPENAARPYRIQILNDCNQILAESGNWALYALLLTLPLLCVVITVLLLFGQKPDSAIRAFTETSDWTLSTKISPPPVTEDAHYLCTVALQGHEELVKPTRMGLRRGEKIVVNRQLCVANAFEQLLEERTPRFHRALRNFYDTYGYPISRHIKTPVTADLIYLIMKPLEWLFVVVLYLFDEKPEDRIARQYLPFPEKKGACS